MNRPKMCDVGQKCCLLLCLLCGCVQGLKAGDEDFRPDSGYKEWVRQLDEGLSVLLQDELFTATQVGMCVYDLTSDTLLYARNIRQRMRPASTEKLLTAIVALSELGESHCFTTSLFCTGEVRDSVLWGDVYAVGGFDPRFGKDDMAAFVESLREQGIDSIAGHLFADVSMKDTLKWGWGWCWDDDMPVLTPLLYHGKDCFMERMGEMLHEAGIGYVSVGRECCPAGARLLVSRSHTMVQILTRMMKDSDNLYAEAMFYQVAAKDRRPYASRKDAMYHIEKLVGEMGYDVENYLIADGSGVSLYNYLTPELELALLKYAYRHENIFIPLYASLPVAGKDGTLRRRMKKGDACGNVHAKTGTLEGVSTLAGYAKARNGHRLAFCIMNQGISRAAFGRDFQDKVCELLCK